MLPNVIGIGFPKAGTTFLSEVLGRHPQGCLARRKETHFFSRAADAGAYEQQFAHCSPQARIALEWTVQYISDADALHRIKSAPTFLLAYRDPVDSFFSKFGGAQQQNPNRPENSRPVADFVTEDYVARFRFDLHLERLRSIFPEARLIVVRCEALLRDRDRVFRALYDALGLDYSPIHLDVPDQNVTLVPRFKLLDRLFRKVLSLRYGEKWLRLYNDSILDPRSNWIAALRRWNSTQIPREPAVVSRLQDMLRPGFERFESMLASDLNCVWVR